MQTIFGFTHPEPGPYPPVLFARKTDAGELAVEQRGPASADGAEGPTLSFALPAADARRLAHCILQRIGAPESFAPTDPAANESDGPSGK